MNIYRIANKVEYLQYFDNMDEDTDIEDPYEQAIGVFNEVKIRPSSNKEISDIAISGGKVVGSTFTGWDVEQDKESGEEIAVFSFDVAVKPEFRGFLIGPKLIERAIQRFNSERDMYEEGGRSKSIMRVEAVNAKLSDFLIKHYGFKVEMRLPDRTFLTKE